MDASYRNVLLKEAAEHPSRLLSHRKFWKLELWPHYLRLCDDLLFDDPVAGLRLALPGPDLAVRLCKNHPTEVSAADMMILSRSVLGTAYRRNDDIPLARATFAEAKKYAPNASPPALAQYLRRFADLCIRQLDPECFPLIEEGLALYKIGNLVDRHGIAEMLLCRGMAYCHFEQPGRAFDDWSAALNHVEIKHDPRPWYSAVHNLTIFTVEHGTEEQIRVARANLGPAQRRLKTVWSRKTRKFARLKMRWVMALLDSRLGAESHAELELLDVRDAFVDLGFPCEIGWLSTDLARLYLTLAVRGRSGHFSVLGRFLASARRDGQVCV